MGKKTKVMRRIRLFVYFPQVQVPIIVRFCLSFCCFACKWCFFTFLVFNIVCLYLHFVTKGTFIFASVAFCVFLALWAFQRRFKWFLDKAIVLVRSIELSRSAFLLYILTLLCIFWPSTFLFFDKYVVFFVFYWVDCRRLWRFNHSFSGLLFIVLSYIERTDGV